MIWIRHAPAAFEAASRSDTVHWLEHLTLWASALLFRRALHSLRSQPRTSLGWLLLTVIHTGMLGALLTLAPAPLYPLYAARNSAADALADQQLAGLIMWVPMGTAYLVAALELAARALGREPSTQTYLGNTFYVRSGSRSVQVLSLISQVIGAAKGAGSLPGGGTWRVLP